MDVTAQPEKKTRKRTRGRPPDPNIEERKARAWNLRKAGASYRQISDQLGVSAMQANRDVRAVLRDLREHLAEDALDHIAIEVQRLDAMLVPLWPRIQQGDVEAIKTAIKIGERRAKLLGLDAPDKHMVAATAIVADEKAQPQHSNIFIMDTGELTKRLVGLVTAMNSAPSEAEIIDVPGVVEAQADPQEAYALELARRKGGNGNGNHG